jgi:hypothetical protein
MVLFLIPATTPEWGKLVMNYLDKNKMDIYSC